MRVLLGLALTALLSQTALAEDWRYCLAPSHAEHKIYISSPFPAIVSMDDAESQFGRTLSRSGYRFDDVQCPRSDDESGALTMREHAIAMNRDLGNQVVDLRWRPGN